MLRQGLASIISVLVVAAIGGCGGSDDSASGGSSNGAAAGKGTIKVGVLAPITGDSAADGKQMVNGAELAVKELNAAGGVAGYKFETKVADTQNSKADAVAQAVQGMISDSDVGVVVSEYASLNNFEVKEFGEARMPYIIGGNSVATRDMISKDPANFPTVWSLAPLFEAYGTDPPVVINQWAEDGLLKLRNHKAFVISSDNPYSEGIAEGLRNKLKETGWTIAGTETVPFATVNDWGTILAKLRSADPDLIIFTDYQIGNEASFMKQFAENPTKSVVLMQYGPSVPDFAELAGEAGNGVVFTNIGGALDSEKWPEGKKVADAYEAEYGVPAGDSGGDVYTMVKLYANALEKVGDPAKREEIGAAIGATDGDLPQGRIKFDQATHLTMLGDDLMPLQIGQIIDSKRVLLSPTNYTDSKFTTPPWMK